MSLEVVSACGLVGKHTTGSTCYDMGVIWLALGQQGLESGPRGLLKPI